jgi:hypothetical protein
MSASILTSAFFDTIGAVDGPAGGCGGGAADAVDPEIPEADPVNLVYLLSGPTYSGTYPLLVWFMYLYSRRPYILYVSVVFIERIFIPFSFYYGCSIARE